MAPKLEINPFVFCLPFDVLANLLPRSYVSVDSNNPRLGDTYFLVRGQVESQISIHITLVHLGSSLQQGNSRMAWSTSAGIPPIENSRGVGIFVP